MKVRVQAQHLQLNDIVGSGEVVEGVASGTRTPKGKVEIYLSKGDKKRMCYWGKYTMINAERNEPTTPMV